MAPDAGTRPRLAVLGQGTRGDLYPLLGIGRQLAARGHRVEVLEYDEYEADVTAAGLRFVSAGTGSQCASVFANVPTGPVTARTEWMIGSLYFEASLDSAEPFVRATGRLAPRPDALLAPANHVGAMLAAELLEVPLVPVFLGPAVLRQLAGDGPAAQGRPERRAQAREAALIDRFALPRLVRIRRAVGLAPLPPGASFGREPDRGGLLLTPRVLLPDEPLPPGFDLAGYPDYFGPRPGRRQTAVPEFLAAGTEPVVVCSLGDGWGRALPGPLRELAVEADRGRYRLVIVGGRMSGLSDGPRTLVTAAADLRWLLGRADVCVHHGGMGTVVAALRCAIPSVTVPQWPDGRRNARALARCGLAIDVGSHAHPGDVVRAVDDVLADPARRARLREVRDAMRREPDPAATLMARLAG